MNNIPYTPNGQVVLCKRGCYRVHGLVAEGSPKESPMITEIYGFWDDPSRPDGIDNFYLPLPGGYPCGHILYGSPMSFAAAQKYADFLVCYYSL